MARKALPLMTILLTMLSACATETAEGPGGRAIDAIVLTAGSGVRIDGRSARNGATLGQGGAVSTAPGSSALVVFENGAQVQLAEGSDPVTFRWSPQELTIRMDDTLLQAQSGGEEEGFSLIRLIGKLARAFVFSRVYVEEDARVAFRTDLVDGRMRLVEPAAGPEQGPGRYALVTAAGAVDYGVTSPARLAFLRSQFDQWRFRRPAVQRGPRNIGAPTVVPGVRIPTIRRPDPRRPDRRDDDTTRPGSDGTERPRAPITSAPGLTIPQTTPGPF